MIQIGNIYLHFDMQSEIFARNLYGGWTRFFALYVKPVAEDVLTQYNKPNEQLEISKLELDLGIMLEEELEYLFPIRLHQQLEEALLKCLHNPTEQQSVVRKSSTQNAYELLCRFLLHGSLPWNAQQQYGSIAKLFLQVLQSHSAQLKRFLHTYGHYTSLQERLVYQLNQPELEEGIRLLALSESVFIILYIRLLAAKYKQVEKPAVRQSEHILLIWKVVYAYLLTNRSSYFNKKSFVQQTLIGLASSYNTSYEAILQLLCSNLNSYTYDTNLTPELFRLLHDLSSESDAIQLERTSLSPVLLYKSLSIYLQNEWQQGLEERSREALIRMLSQPDSCRCLLQLISEHEIISLVHIVIPSDSGFVVEYARQLDDQKERGKLQGKAGSEFTKLKWQFIFVLLLSNTGAAFNRKYFTESVLTKIAAHYNLSISELLDYFYGEIEKLKLNNSLRRILTDLYDKHTRIKKEESLSNSINTWVNRFKNKKNFQPKTIEKLWNSLADVQMRYDILSALHEEEHRRLVVLLLKQHSEFVLSYAISLDQQHQHENFEDKTSSKFRQLKWIFIWTVLAETRQAAFNQKHFVSGVIRNMAAHYNLSYLELLSYFYISAERLQPNAAIRSILNELYFDKRKQLIEQVLHIRHEESIRQLLLAFYPKHHKLIWSFGKWLYNIILPQLSLKSSHAEHVKLAWTTLFRTLEKSNNQPTFNLSLFVRNVLKELAQHFQITLNQLIKYEWIQDQQTLLTELVQVLSEVYYEQTGKKPAIAANASKEKSAVDNNQQALATVSSAKSMSDKPEMPENSMSEPTYINNAGLALVNPFLPRLFSMLELAADGKLKNRDAQIRAMFIMQYLVFGRTEFPEYQMTFNKLLTGFETEKPIPFSIELADEEKKAADSMLTAVLQHWEKLKNTSLAGLREGFLQREGKLQQTDKGMLLTVENKSYDMLLDSLPWSYSTIKYSWMKDIIHVKWR